MRENKAHKKFAPPPTPLKQEESLTLIVPREDWQVDQLKSIIEAELPNAKSARKNALEFWKMQLEQQDAISAVNQQFVRGFWCWLLGRGTDDEHNRTLWGRHNVATANSEVAAYVDELARKKTEYTLQLVQMANRVPMTLNGFYLYYKYIVQGKLRVVPSPNGQSDYYVDDDDFLNDWNTFQRENRAYDGYIHPFNQHGNAAPFDTNKPYPYTEEQMRDEACDAPQGERLAVKTEHGSGNQVQNVQVRSVPAAPAPAPASAPASAPTPAPAPAPQAISEVQPKKEERMDIEDDDLPPYEPLPPPGPPPPAQAPLATAAQTSTHKGAVKWPPNPPPPEDEDEDEEDELPPLEPANQPTSGPPPPPFVFEPIHTVANLKQLDSMTAERPINAAVRQAHRRARNWQRRAINGFREGASAAGHVGFPLEAADDLLDTQQMLVLHHHVNNQQGLQDSDLQDLVDNNRDFDTLHARAQLTSKELAQKSHNVNTFVPEEQRNPQIVPELNTYEQNQQQLLAHNRQLQETVAKMQQERQQMEAEGMRLQTQVQVHQQRLLEIREHLIEAMSRPQASDESRLQIEALDNEYQTAQALQVEDTNAQLRLQAQLNEVRERLAAHERELQSRISQEQHAAAEASMHQNAQTRQLSRVEPADIGGLFSPFATAAQAQTHAVQQNELHAENVATHEEHKAEAERLKRAVEIQEAQDEEREKQEADQAQQKREREQAAHDENVRETKRQHEALANEDLDKIDDEQERETRQNARAAAAQRAAKAQAERDAYMEEMQRQLAAEAQEKARQREERRRRRAQQKAEEEQVKAQMQLEQQEREARERAEQQRKAVVQANLMAFANEKARERERQRQVEEATRRNEEETQQKEKREREQFEEEQEIAEAQKDEEEKRRKRAEAAEQEEYDEQQMRRAEEEAQLEAMQRSEHELEQERSEAAETAAREQAKVARKHQKEALRSAQQKENEEERQQKLAMEQERQHEQDIAEAQKEEEDRMRREQEEHHAMEAMREAHERQASADDAMVMQAELEHAVHNAKVTKYRRLTQQHQAAVQGLFSNPEQVLANRAHRAHLREIWARYRMLESAQDAQRAQQNHQVAQMHKRKARMTRSDALAVAEATKIMANAQPRSRPRYRNMATGESKNSTPAKMMKAVRNAPVGSSRGVAAPTPVRSYQQTHRREQNKAFEEEVNRDIANMDRLKRERDEAVEEPEHTEPGEVIMHNMRSKGKAELTAEEEHARLDKWHEHLQQGHIQKFDKIARHLQIAVHEHGLNHEVGVLMRHPEESDEEHAKRLNRAMNLIRKKRGLQKKKLRLEVEQEHVVHHATQLHGLPIRRGSSKHDGRED